MAMQLYDQIKAETFQQANNVWERSVYENIREAITRGQLSTAIQKELFLRCFRGYV